MKRSLNQEEPSFLKRVIRSLGNVRGFVSIESIIVTGVIIVLAGFVLTMFESQASGTDTEIQAVVQNEIAETADPADAFSLLEQDVALFLEDAGFMPTEEKVAKGSALLERMNVMFAETSDNAEATNSLLSWEEDIEAELAYGS